MSRGGGGVKVLLDENMPHDFLGPLKEAGHEPISAERMGWKSIRNGRLLKLAADEGFDVIVTPARGPGRPVMRLLGNGSGRDGRRIELIVSALARVGDPRAARMPRRSGRVYCGP